MVHSLCCTRLNINRTVSKSRANLTSIVKHKALPTNPWLASITSQYAWNLKKDFAIYFLSPSDSSQVTKALNFLDARDGNVSVMEGSSFAKSATLDCARMYAQFIGKNIAPALVYNQANIIVIFLDDPEYTLDFYGVCTGTQHLYDSASIVDNKVWLYINKTLVNDISMKKGGSGRTLLLHELGHAFGINHPHDTGGKSSIMPGISTLTESIYGGSGAFDQNHVLNTVMSYNWFGNSLPSNGSIDWTNSDVGYPETLMPYDYAALRHLYGITGFPDLFLQNYGFRQLFPNRTMCYVGQGELVVPPTARDTLIYFGNASIDPLMQDGCKGLSRALKQYGAMTMDSLSYFHTIYFKNSGNAILVVSNMYMDRNVFVEVPLQIDIYFARTVNRTKAVTDKGVPISIFTDMDTNKVVRVIGNTKIIIKTSTQGRPLTFN